jgi:hypothetical protein
LELEGILTSVLNSRLDMIEDMGKKSRIIAERFDWGKVTDSYLKEFYA